MKMPDANPADVASIDAIVTAAYDVISGPAGKRRDWARDRALFWPGARLIPTATVPGRNDVDLARLFLELDYYIERFEPIFTKGGFYEKEIARRLEQFGSITRLSVMYESRPDTNYAAPFMRGINSIQ